jgi:diaminohydroxyphosphoribosylaminopyrimidine deaminase/5-amino-6-(5-phosphoribosylamino)uracil reductase
LAAAGVAVSTGVRSAEARALNAGFLSRVERGRPWVTVKIAQSLDGRTALANGESRWITGEAARRDVQFLRARHAAVLTGIDTVLRDDARLNVRLSADELDIEAPVRQPVRVVLDSGLRLSPFAPLFDVAGGVWLYTQAVNGSVRAEELAARGADLLAAPYQAGKGLDLGYILEDLAQRGINEVLVEAGAKLSGAFLSAGWVDELIIYQAPVLLGPDAQPSAALPALSALDQAMRWLWVESTLIGADIRHVLRPASSVVTAGVAGRGFYGTSDQILREPSC